MGHGRRKRKQKPLACSAAPPGNATVAARTEDINKTRRLLGGGVTRSLLLLSGLARMSSSPPVWSKRLILSHSRRVHNIWSNVSTSGHDARNSHTERSSKVQYNDKRGGVASKSMQGIDRVCSLCALCWLSSAGCGAFGMSSLVFLAARCCPPMQTLPVQVSQSLALERPLLNGFICAVANSANPSRSCGVNAVEVTRFAPPPLCIATKMQHLIPVPAFSALPTM